MYYNLVFEMKKNKIAQSQISDLLGVRQATVSDKLSGKSRFYFDEAYKIKSEFFPHTEIEYLFDFSREIS